MDNQEAFDNVTKHLFAQKKPAANMWWSKPAKRWYATCKYITPDNCKCAIGALMPDIMCVEAPSDNIHVVLRDFTPAQIHFKGVNPRLLNELQTVHDQMDYWLNWNPKNPEPQSPIFDLALIKSDLQHVAVRYGLKTTTLDQQDIT